VTAPEWLNSPSDSLHRYGDSQGYLMRALSSACSAERQSVPRVFSEWSDPGDRHIHPPVARTYGGYVGCSGALNLRTGHIY
jgi:hypothetical protein